jgi:WD40 repeat protein
MSVAYKYRAFISYSRADRERAVLLQTRLVRYLLPRALRRIKAGVTFDRRPLKPIFRDEDELVPGQDLPNRIRVGLQESEFLIVLCSPNAVASGWVDKEILDFAALGKANNILAIVVGGEPLIEQEHLEALPRALRFEIDLEQMEDGKTKAIVSGRTATPLYVDLRGRLADDRHQFLTIVAALLSLQALDDLVRKDHVFQVRRTVMRWAIGSVVAASFLALGIVLVARARTDRVTRLKVLTRLAQQAGRSGDWERAGRYAASALSGADSLLTGFDPRLAEDALMGVLFHNRRISTPRKLAGPALALSHNGRVVLVDVGADRVQAVETETGKPVAAPFAVGADLAFAISSDGKLVATSGNDNAEGKIQIRIWDVATGKQVFTTMASDGQIVAGIEFSPDGSRLALNGKFGDGGGGLELFDLASGRGDVLAGYPEGIDSFAFSPNGREIVAGWHEGVQAWDAESRKPTTEILSIGSATAQKVVALTTGRILAVWTTDGGFVFWDLEKKQEFGNANLPDGSVQEIKFSDDGKRLGVRFTSGMVRIWQGENPKSYPRTGVRFAPGGQFAFLADGKKMVTVDGETLRLWDLAPFLRETELRGLVEDAALSPDGQILVTAGWDDLIALDTRTMQPAGPRIRVKRPNSNGVSVAFSPDGTLVTLQNDEGTWVANWRSGDQWSIPVRPFLDRAIEFSPDSSTLALTAAETLEKDGHAQNWLYLWNVNTRKQIGDRMPAPPSLLTLLFSKNGKVLAMGPSFRPVEIRDLNTGRKIGESIKGMGAVAFMPGEKQLVTGSEDDRNGDARENLQLWDIASGAAVGDVMKTGEEVLQILPVGDGSRAYAIGTGTISLWDLRETTEIGIHREGNDRLRKAWLTLDRQRLIVWANRHLYEWSLGRTLDLRGPQLLKEVCGKVIPGAFAELSSEELAATPVLKPNQDSDACLEAK